MKKLLLLVALLALTSTVKADGLVIQWWDHDRVLQVTKVPGTVVFSGGYGVFNADDSSPITISAYNCYMLYCTDPNDSSTIMLIYGTIYPGECGNPDYWSIDSNTSISATEFNADDEKGGPPVLSPDDVLPPYQPPLNPAGPLLPA